MNDREKFLVQYALLVALYGEDSVQVRELETQLIADTTLFAAMTEIVVLYRELKEGKR